MGLCLALGLGLGQDRGSEKGGVFWCWLLTWVLVLVLVQLLGNNVVGELDWGIVKGKAVLRCLLSWLWKVVKTCDVM